MAKADWKGALELLDTAVGDTPCNRQRLWARLALSKSLVIKICEIYYLYFLLFSRLLQRHRILVKARQGESIITDVRKLQKGGETNCASLWHQAALGAVNVTQQLAYYKYSITSPMVLSLFLHSTQIWSMSSHRIRKISLSEASFCGLTHRNHFSDTLPPPCGGRVSLQQNFSQTLSDRVSGHSAQQITFK